MNKMIIANLKTFMHTDDVINYLKDMKDLNNYFIVCPSNIYIPYFLKYKYTIGVQDISMFDSIDITGELLASQAFSMGIKYSIIGHSDRRNFETIEDINKKILVANKYGITPLLCVGETKKGKKTKKYIAQYLSECLKNTLVNKIVIVYEPTWAIGTNIIPTNEEIIDIVKYIKEFVKKEYDVDIKVLYGGSVNKENINTIKLIDEIDGILVGSASTISSEFKEIVTKYLK